MMSIITTYLHVYPDTLGSAQTKSVGEIPKHKHDININLYAPNGSNSAWGLTDGSKFNTQITVNYAGNDEYHNNMSPSISGYAWIRTA
jgi:hypothetical protein